MTHPRSNTETTCPRLDGSGATRLRKCDDLTGKKNQFDSNFVLSPLEIGLTNRETG